MKRSMMLLPAALLAVLALAATDGFVLKRTAKVGDVLKFKMEAQLEFNGTPITFGGTVTEKVTKVEDNGNYTVESQNTDTKIVMDGNEQSLPDQPASVSVYKPSGEVVEMRGENVSAESYRMANMSLMKFSEKEIKVGDKWSVEGKADSKTGAVAFKVDWEVQAEEKIGNFDTVKIKFLAKETEGASPASSEGTAWVDKATATLVKMEAKWVNAPMPGAPMPITATVKMTRI